MGFKHTQRGLLRSSSIASKNTVMKSATSLTWSCVNYKQKLNLGTPRPKISLNNMKITHKNLSFYKFQRLQESILNNLAQSLLNDWGELCIKGRIYVAKEGINAQITVPTKYIESFARYTEKIFPGVTNTFNYGVDQQKEAFQALHVKVRDQIVTADEDVLPDESPSYLNAIQWHKTLDEEDVVLVDVRNAYESAIGYFEKAIKPPVHTFKQSLPIIKDLLNGKEDKKVLLYCTGGIRCVKASGYLKQHGFKNVHQLFGGIIRYAQEIKDCGLESKFKGMNFCFDDRLAERITEDVVSTCHQCGQAADTPTNCKNNSCNALMVQCNSCAVKFKGTCSKECQEIIQLPEDLYRQHLKTAQASMKTRMSSFPINVMVQ